MFVCHYDPKMAYGYAVAFGTLYSILMALAAVSLFILATVPWENRTGGGGDDWLVLVAIAMFVSALLVFAGVMTARVWLVAPAYLVGAVVSLPALRYALADWSDHADGQLIGAALGIGACGLLAAVLTARAAREPGMQGDRP